MTNSRGMQQIDKKLISGVALFAIRNVPDVDDFTLNKLLELVNTAGSFGSLTDSQLRLMISTLQKYVPHTCDRTLEIFVDLLTIHLPPEPRNSNGHRPDMAHQGLAEIDLTNRDT